MAAEHPTELIAALRRAECYPHPVDTVQVVETHISWVLLAGEFAYKLKKPVDFGFLDFGTLDKRRACCEDEVRLNRRLAPELYLDVVAVSGPPSAPRVGGSGPAIEYAVRMRRFAREDELDALAARGALRREHIEALAGEVARFHDRVAVAGPDSPWGTPEAVLAPCEENFAHLWQLDHDAADLALLEGLRAWTRTEHARLAGTFERRRAEGRVRECHGDLHLGNIVMIGDRPVPFDAIEFNASLRWIDVASEVAFTVMDLHHRGRPELAHAFLNAWLEHGGDYDGLAVLPFYLVYRAMVRAKVAGLRAAQQAPGSAGRNALMRDLRTHLELAQAFARARPRALAITCGASGSGKSFVAGRLAEAGDWIRVRSDVERKRLAGLQPRDAVPAAVGDGLYAPEMTERTYARLAQIARKVLAAGFPVIVDATFLDRGRRDAFRRLAGDAGVACVVLATTASPQTLRARVAERARAGADPSDATLEVLEAQLSAPGLDADEDVVRVDTGAPLDVQALDARLRFACSG